MYQEDSESGGCGQECSRRSFCKEVFTWPKVAGKSV